MKKSVAVIGGGITGLTAAFRLQQAGHPVTIYEASERPGGVIRSIQQDDWLVECGPNTMLETSPVITKLVEEPELGIADRRRDASPLGGNRFVLKNGKPVLLPSSPGGFLKTPLFSLKAKMRLLKEPFIGKSASNAPEESLADFVRRRIGQEFLDYAINPFVAGVYAGDPENLSVKYGFPKLYDLEQKYGSLIRGQVFGAKERKKRETISKDKAKQLSFDQGLQVLTDALAIHACENLRLNSKVTSLAQSAGGQWELTTEGSEESTIFHEVILALPAYRMAELQFKSHFGKGSQSMTLLEEIVYPPVASVVLGFKKEDVTHPLNGFGTLNPEVEKVNTLGTLFTSTLFPERAPEGHVLLTTYLGGTRSPELALKPENERMELVFNDLKSIYGISGDPVFAHSFLYENAIPQYEVGYGKFLKYMHQFETSTKGIHLAGHCKDGISLADSIVSGEKVAAKIISKV